MFLGTSTVAEVRSKPLFFRPNGRAVDVEGPFFARSTDKLRLSLYALLVAIDLWCVATAVLMAGALRLGSPFEHQSTATLGVLLPIYLAIALNNGAYSLHALKRAELGCRKASQALCYALAIAIGVLFFLKISVQFPRTVFALGTGLALIFIVTARMLLGKYLAAKSELRFSNELLILDGVDVEHFTGTKILDAKRMNLHPQTNNPQFADEIGRLLEKCDRVVLAAKEDRRAAWLVALKGIGIDIEVLAMDLEGVGPIALRRYGEHPTLVVGAKPLSISDAIKKRALDLSASLLTLVFLAPLLMAVALAIKIDSPGPVFFRQKRLGRSNRIFDVLKFRTMRVDAADQDGRVLTARNDGRITRVGRLLRKTSIDELPQLLNVVLGDMSLVGPRPHALQAKAGKDLYWDVHPGYWTRAAVKPGLTGLAQVRGHRGPTETGKHLIDRVDSDLEYLTGWSMWRDLKIIFATFRVLAHPNAY